MIGALIITFREIFEISIVLCIVLAATKGVPHRGKWIFAGVAAGAIVSILIGIFANVFAHLTSSFNPQLLNAIVLLVTAGLIMYTVLWMQKQGREIAHQAKSIGQAVAVGEKPLHMLAIVVGLSVLREGVEVVLFLYGLIASSETSSIRAIEGAFVGSLLGVIAGLLLYYGMLRIPMKYFFAVIRWMLTFLAASMMSNAAGKLASINILPTLGAPIWNSSMLLSQDSILGRLLHMFLGYLDKPMGIQLIFYIATIFVIMGLPKILQKE
jgi:high-affinity iron transporter